MLLKMLCPLELCASYCYVSYDYSSGPIRNSASYAPQLKANQVYLDNDPLF